VVQQSLADSVGCDIPGEVPWLASAKRCVWPLFKICEGQTKFAVPSLKESVCKTASHIKYYKTNDKRATIMVILKHETGFRWLYSPADDKCECLGAEATTYFSMYTK